MPRDLNTVSAFIRRRLYTRNKFINAYYGPPVNGNDTVVLIIVAGYSSKGEES
jgi:hypothetical protein